MKKRDVGMAKHFSIKYRNKGWAFDYPVSVIWNKFLFCQDACQCLMLHPYITASRTIINIVLSGVELGHSTLSQPCKSGVVRYMYSPFYIASVVLLKLHGCVVSHMEVCIILNTDYAGPLQLKEFNFSYLFLRQWCRDVASGIDRHHDRTEIDFRLQIQGNRKLIPCSCTF